jgi:hypothetical protein
LGADSRDRGSCGALKDVTAALGMTRTKGRTGVHHGQPIPKFDSA